jgi:hypothetical protein
MGEMRQGSAQHGIADHQEGHGEAGEHRGSLRNQAASTSGDLTHFSLAARGAASDAEVGFMMRHHEIARGGGHADPVAEFLFGPSLETRGADGVAT